MKATFYFTSMILFLVNNTFAVPTITRGAYLQMLTTNSIVIRWQTDISSDSKVSFGTSITYNQTVTDVNLVTEHEMKLTGLIPNTKYFYQIGTTATPLQGNANNYFKTAIPLGSSDFTAWVIGDFGAGTAGQLSVRNLSLLTDVRLPLLQVEFRSPQTKPKLQVDACACNREWCLTDAG